MTNGLVLLARWSVRPKLNRVSSVQLRRFVRVFRYNWPYTFGRVAGSAVCERDCQSSVDWWFDSCGYILNQLLGSRHEVFHNINIAHQMGKNQQASFWGSIPQ